MHKYQAAAVVLTCFRRLFRRLDKNKQVRQRRMWQANVLYDPWHPNTSESSSGLRGLGVRSLIDTWVESILYDRLCSLCRESRRNII